jgi:hypothetical protein
MQIWDVSSKSFIIYKHGSDTMAHSPINEDISLGTVFISRIAEEKFAEIMSMLLGCQILPLFPNSSVLFYYCVSVMLNSSRISSLDL